MRERTSLFPTGRDSRMPRNKPSSDSGWVLHVQPNANYVSDLVFERDGFAVLSVHLTPAKTAFMLVLIGAFEMDRLDGMYRMLGFRSVEEIAADVAVVPGPGNPVGAAVPGDTKRAICRLIHKKPRWREQRENITDPVVHPGYGQGYTVCRGSIKLVGIDLDEIVRRLRARRIR